MPATAAQIAQTRRMTAEPDETTYTDADLAAYIQAYPLGDMHGYDVASVLWTPTYDLNAAAADVWDEKTATAVASAASGAVSGSVQSVAVAGATFTLGGSGSSSAGSDPVAIAQHRARYYRARRAARTVSLRGEA